MQLQYLTVLSRHNNNNNLFKQSPNIGTSNTWVNN
jgi:hypothetical protein